MSKSSVQKAYNEINHSIFFYLPFLLIYLKNSHRKYTIIEVCFYFVFVFDENYLNLFDGMKCSSNLVEKIKESHYYKMRNKNDFLELYYIHFLKMISYCMKCGLLILEDNNLLLTEEGNIFTRNFEQKINKFPPESFTALLTKNVKVLAGLTIETKLINFLEKIGVKSL